MQLTPDEEFKRKLELRPGVPKPTPANTTPQPKPALDRTMEDPEQTPEALARKALGLKPSDPTPQLSTLTPQMQQALAKLDPATRKQVMGVSGCMGAMIDDVRGLSEKISKDMDGCVEQTRKTSLGLRLVLRRADKGTLSPQDLSRASQIIENQSQGRALDPTTLGLDKAHQQGNQMVGAANQMLAQLREQAVNAEPEQQQAIVQVEALVSTLAGEVQRSVQAAHGLFKQTDQERVQALLQAQTGLRQEAAPAGAYEQRGLGSP